MHLSLILCFILEHITKHRFNNLTVKVKMKTNVFFMNDCLVHVRYDAIGD